LTIPTPKGFRERFDPHPEPSSLPVLLQFACGGALVAMRRSGRMTRARRHFGAGIGFKALALQLVAVLPGDRMARRPA
jgi:hypothetical protein